MLNPSCNQKPAAGHATWLSSSLAVRWLWYGPHHTADLRLSVRQIRTFWAWKSKTSTVCVKHWTLLFLEVVFGICSASYLEIPLTETPNIRNSGIPRTTDWNWQESGKKRIWILQLDVCPPRGAIRANQDLELLLLVFPSEADDTRHVYLTKMKEIVFRHFYSKNISQAWVRYKSTKRFIDPERANSIPGIFIFYWFYYYPIILSLLW